MLNAIKTSGKQGKVTISVSYHSFAERLPKSDYASKSKQSHWGYLITKVVALGNELDIYVKFKSLFDPKTKFSNTGV